jgi:N-acyl-D-amino-acid deacylase
MLLLSGCTRDRADLVVRNGLVVDGAGQAGSVRDIAVRDGRIQAIGAHLSMAGRREIDARGLVVSPGFVDVHSHSDRSILKDTSHHNMLLQGITTSVTGNCGMSPIDIGKFFVDLTKTPPASNIAVLIGHNSVREAVMGREDKAPSPEQLARMQELVTKAMHDGALGMSTGLFYAPGYFAKPPEIEALARIVAAQKGIYTSHVRTELEGVFDAIDEALDIGRKTGVPVQISHLKIATDALWGQSSRVLAMIEEARRQGVVVREDLYPYAAWMSRLDSALPRWPLEGGRNAFLARLRDPSMRAGIIRSTLEEWHAADGKNRAQLFAVAQYPPNRAYEGKTLAEISQSLGKSPTPQNGAETLLQLLEKTDDAYVVGFLMNEADVEAFLRDPSTMVSTDGWGQVFGSGVPHPRNYGTYPRVLARYVREQHALTLEQAIHKMTALPAATMGIRDRGTLAAGAAADMVVFDPAAIKDNATFQQPHQYPSGIRFVVVNGRIAAEDGKMTGERAGQVIRGPGYRAN